MVFRLKNSSMIVSCQKILAGSMVSALPLVLPWHGPFPRDVAGCVSCSGGYILCMTYACTCTCTYNIKPRCTCTARAYGSRSVCVFVTRISCLQNRVQRIKRSETALLLERGGPDPVPGTRAEGPDPIPGTGPGGLGPIPRTGTRAGGPVPIPPGRGGRGLPPGRDAGLDPGSPTGARKKASLDCKCISLSYNEEERNRDYLPPPPPPPPLILDFN